MMPKRYTPLCYGCALPIVSMTLFLWLTATCSRPAATVAADADSTTVTARYADRYDQRRTEACWVYAMVACIEHEAAMVGDSLTLSRQWIMARNMEEQAMDHYDARRRGDPATTITMRGVGRHVLTLIDRYGMVPLQQERSAMNNSRVLERKLTLLTERLASRGTEREAVRREVVALLPRLSVVNGTDEHDGAASQFYYLSMRYTARQFAQSVMYRQRWTFYQAVDQSFFSGKTKQGEGLYDVADNGQGYHYRYADVGNGSSESPLLTMVRASLRAGHAVYWEYSKRGRETDEHGVMPSDHAMAIVGMHGDRLVCLNSYGREWGNNGYCMVNARFFNRHTSSVAIISDDRE